MDEIDNSVLEADDVEPDSDVGADDEAKDDAEPDGDVKDEDEAEDDADPDDKVEDDDEAEAPPKPSPTKAKGQLYLICRPPCAIP